MEGRFSRVTRLKQMIKAKFQNYKIYKYLDMKKHFFRIEMCKYNKVYFKSKKELTKLRNKHISQRCFIIGNGPSLKLEDLEKIKNEVTFASNKIFTVFDEVEFRPTYYFSQDQLVIEQLILEDPDIFNKIDVGNVFLPIDIKLDGVPYMEKVTYFYLTRKNSYPQKPQFSSDVSKVVHEGMTVTYTAIQFAVHMGFEEIFLMGVDHNFSNVMMPDGTVIKNEDVKDYFTDKYKYTRIMNPASKYMIDLAYISAKEYCDTHNIKIYNATRGGKLETFERVDFDDIRFN